MVAKKFKNSRDDARRKVPARRLSVLALIVFIQCLCNIFVSVSAKPSQLDSRLNFEDCDSSPACLPANNHNHNSHSNSGPAKSLIATTSDAIYRALSNVFTTYEPADYEASERMADSNQVYEPIRQRQQPKGTTTNQSHNIDKTSLASNTTAIPSTARPRPSRPTSAPTRPAAATTTSSRPSASIRVTTTASTTSSTSRRPTTTTTTTTTTSKPPITTELSHLNAADVALANSSTGGGGGDHSMNELLDDALRSIFSLKETMMRNRTTRLAPPHFADLKLVDLFEASGSPTSNASDRDQLATREDVHLLCKLLHKRLESSSDHSSGQAANSSQTPPPIDGAGRAQKRTGLYVADLRDLNGTLDGYLLESVFSLLADKPNKTNASTLTAQTRGETALLSLFNLAATLRQPQAPGNREPIVGLGSLRNSSLVPAETSDESSESDSSYESSLPARAVEARITPLVGGPFVIRSWSSVSSTKADGESTLRLVYWLLEKSTSSSGTRQFRLVDQKEAQNLLEMLEFSQIERHLDSMRLKPLRSLVSSYGTRSAEFADEQPLVLDDSLGGAGGPAAAEGGKGSQPKPGSSMKPKSGFQMLVDRFGESSFYDNLHLYLILFILVLVLIILCVAVPMICCRGSSSETNRRSAVGRAAATRRRRANNNNGSRAQAHIGTGSADNLATISGSKNLLLASSGGECIGNREEGDERNQAAAKLQQQSDAIWRKLSNTTTTLIKDESSVLVRNDGTTGAGLAVGDRFERQPGSAGHNQLFEWYPFHTAGPDLAGFDQTQARTHKSVQTNESRLLKQHQQAMAGAPDTRRPTTVHSRSDTMSKSELVMLKEKMIPIMQERRQQLQQASTQTSQEARDHDYVNQSQMVPPARQTSPPSSSSSSSKANSNEDSQASQKRAPQLEDCISSMPSRHIDSSDSRSIGLEQHRRQQQQQQHPSQPLEEQRQPSMRRLELPAKTRSKVEAIKTELEKLEQRDSASTYKRYDVI